MTNDTPLITAGDKVTASQVALLQKLSINPFTYGFVLKLVYENGNIFDAKVLDITDDVLAAKFSEALKVIASLSLAIGYPTQASVPHSIANAFRAIIAVTIGLESYSFAQAEPYRAVCCKKPEPETPAEEEAAPAPAPAAASDY